MSSKTSARERRARVEAMKAEQRREQRRRNLIWVRAALTAAVVLVAGVVWMSSRGSGGSTATGDGQIAGLQTYTGLARDHVTGKVTYPQTPPVGGQHSAVWQNCGIYSSPVANEHAVHSLEHGAMWITYQPDLPRSQVDLITADVAGQRYALVSPYPGLPAPVVATVWGAQLKLDSASDPRLKMFIDTYASGMKAPEPAGECTGGIGNPIK
jgi:hypothetical protein